VNKLWIDEVVRLYFEGYTVNQALAKVNIMKADYEKLFKYLTNRRC